MSLQDDKSTNDDRHSGRVVTDSVHSRFRTTEVYCDICNMNISGNHSAISKHFNNSHPSEEYCCYCKDKVFSYILIPIQGSTEKRKRIVYHKCNRPET